MGGIVIDVGCCDWGDQRSIVPLVERFRPKHLIGLDPYPEIRPDTFLLASTVVEVRKVAAWVFDGDVLFAADGTRSHIAERPAENVSTVPCIDLAAFVAQFEEPVVLKLDCEWAEYELVPHLVQTGAWENVSTWLIEWHGEPLEGLPFEWEKP
jgi:FkbM family methyltransferase